MVKYDRNWVCQYLDIYKQDIFNIALMNVHVMMVLSITEGAFKMLLARLTRALAYLGPLPLLMMKMMMMLIIDITTVVAVMEM